MRRSAVPDSLPDVEPETLDGGGPATGVEPLDATRLRIDGKPLALDHLVSRLAKGGIDLYPDFQPKAGLWSAVDQSRLIESLLIRLPIPAFYFDASDDRHWLVVDGLQRLTALKAFAVERKLKLRGLEYHGDLNGKTFNALPRHFQRRILETQVTAFLLREGCPTAIKFNLFRRINTGGRPLAPQQIRHALHQGQATRFLKLLAGSKDFRAVAGEGLADRELSDQACVLRFLAFRMAPRDEYRSGDFDAFLAKQMARLNEVDGKTLKVLRGDFQRALSAAGSIFGDRAFRRHEPPAAFNKALFEVWSVCLAALEADQLEKLVDRREVLNQEFIKLLLNNSAFNKALSQATGSVASVKKRYQEIEKLVQGVLE